MTALLAKSCKGSAHDGDQSAVFCAKIDFTNYLIKFGILAQVAWEFISHLGLPYWSIVKSIGILRKPYK